MKIGIKKNMKLNKRNVNKEASTIKLKIDVNENKNKNKNKIMT